MQFNEKKRNDFDGEVEVKVVWMVLNLREWRKIEGSAQVLERQAKNLEAVVKLNMKEECWKTVKEAIYL